MISVAGVLLYTIIAMTALSTGQRLKTYSMYTEIVKGLYFNEIPNVMTYESYIPITFELELPKLEPPQQKNTTTGTDCVAESFICSLFSSTLALSNAMYEELVTKHPYLHSSKVTRTTRGLFNFVGISYRWLFGLATVGDIQDLHVSQTFIKNRQDELQSAVVGNQKILTTVIRNLTTYSINLKTVIEEGLQNVMQAVTNERETAYQNELIITDTLSLISKNNYHAIIMTHLDQSASDCRNQIIPRSVLSQTILDSRMKKLNDDLAPHNWETAASLNALYKLPITDCFFTAKSMHVVIHVPIKKINHSYRVFEVVNIPFQFRAQQCSVMDSTEFVVKVNDTVVAITTHLARYCKPEKGFCMVPQFQKGQSAFSNCAAAVITENSAIILKECIYQCRKSNQTRISQINSKEYAVTNAKTLHFTCMDEDHVRVYNIHHDVGAVIVQHPCNCTLEINNDGLIIQPSFPCPNVNDVKEETLTQVIPFHMSLQRNLQILGSTGRRHSTAANVIDYHWNYHLPVLNLTEPQQYEFSKKYLEDTFTSEYVDTKAIVYFWLIILTFGNVLLCLLYTFQIHSKSEKTKYRGTARRRIPMTAATLLIIGAIIPVEAADDSDYFHTALWELLKQFKISNIFIAITTLIIVFIGLYVFCKLYSIFKLIYRCLCLCRRSNRYDENGHVIRLV